MLNLAQIYGLTDQALAALLANGVAYDALLEKIVANAMFGLVNPEVIYGEYVNGQVVPPAISPVDGYQYSRLEMMILGTLKDTASQTLSSPGGGGQIFAFGIGPAPVGGPAGAADGATFNFVQYQTPAGVVTNTSDGIQGVWAFVTRGWSDLKLATSPALTDVLGSNFAQNAPLAQTALRGLNENSRLGAVRSEFFLNAAVPITTISRTAGVVTANTAAAHGFGVGSKISIFLVNTATFNSTNSFPCVTVTAVPSPTQLQWNEAGPDASGIGGRVQFWSYKNGDVVNTPGSFVDGYAYSRAELIYFPAFIGSGSPVTGQVTGPGRISRIILSVNAATGAVSTEVDYWNGTVVTATNDGQIAVMILAQRTVPALGTIQSPVVAVDEFKFFAGQLYDGPTMQQLNINAKAGVLCPEFFGPTNFINGQTVGLPTSPTDGYVYTRGQLQYIYWMTDSGVAPATSHALRRLNFNVNQQTGVVSSTITYSDDTTGNDVVTNQGTLAVITVGRRG